MTHGSDPAYPAVASDDQLRDAMAAAMSGFGAVVTSLEPDHWDRPTPCTDWSVFDIVDHVVAGERFTVEVLAGASLAEAVEAQAGLDTQDPNVVAQLTEAAAAALTAFDGSLDRIIDHRVGPISARRMIGFRIIDQLGHTWDVATSTDQPVALDPVALAVGVEIALAERPTLERSANFATAADDHVESGDPLTTFLRTIGRSPTDG